MKRQNVVGNNIRRFRNLAGITQEELALRSGLSQGYINQLELGKRKYTQKSLEIIATALSAPIIDFFKEDEKAQSPAIDEETSAYSKKKSSRKEFLSLLKELPQAVIDQHFELMKIERELLRKNR